MTEKIKNLTTQCPYCGVGCGLEMQPPAEIGKAVRRDADGYPMWRSRGCLLYTSPSPRDS